MEGRRRKNECVRSPAPLKESSQKTHPTSSVYVSMASPAANVTDRCSLLAGYTDTQIKIWVVFLQ